MASFQDSSTKDIIFTARENDVDITNELADYKDSLMDMLCHHIGTLDVLETEKLASEILGGTYRTSEMLGVLEEKVNAGIEKRLKKEREMELAETVGREFTNEFKTKSNIRGIRDIVSDYAEPVPQVPQNVPISLEVSSLMKMRKPELLDLIISHNLATLEELNRMTKNDILQIIYNSNPHFYRNGVRRAVVRRT